MNEYEFVFEMAMEHGYTYFTSLQENAFRNANVYDYQKDLFIVGETSSGKTLIPLLLYETALRRGLEYERMKIPKLLFVVPYRALAGQKLRELKDFYRSYNLDIVQSTGEYRQDDDAIQSGDLDIAIVINEKAFRFEARNPSFYSHYDFVVFDEVGLLVDLERGARVDMMMTWAKIQNQTKGKPRMIVLGTPFINWDEYIRNYDFEKIESTDRPIQLRDIVIKLNGSCISVRNPATDEEHYFRRVSKRDIEQKEEQNPSAPFFTKCRCISEQKEVFCPVLTPCRTDPSLLCSRTAQPCVYPVEIIEHGSTKIKKSDILADLCIEQLRQGRQVLIFINNREEVRRLCGWIYRAVRQYEKSHDIKLLVVDRPSEECRAQILAETDLERDDLFGVMETDDGMSYYEMFAAGIGFHNAALPNEIRVYVEKKLLDSREMKVVCSTETLAFGVNSTVDTVIIAGLYKDIAGEHQRLSLNEYNNYRGRAGRLSPGMEIEQREGFVYTVVTQGELQALKEMEEGNKNQEPLFSSLTTTRNDSKLPFYILNVLPEKQSSQMRFDEIERLLQWIPREATLTDEVMNGKIRNSLGVLIERNLICRNKVRERGERFEHNAYYLSPLGIRMRGYIIDTDDFDLLYNKLSSYCKPYIDLDAGEVLYTLVQTKNFDYAATTLNKVSMDPRQIREIKQDILNMSPALEHTMEEYPIYGYKLIIFAAILAWSNGECARQIFRKYNIHFALINRISEQIAYLIEVSREILDYQAEEDYQANIDWYNNSLHIDEARFMERRKAKIGQMHRLFASLYYGVDMEVTDLLISYLKKLNTHEANAYAESIKPDVISPNTARDLRKIAVRFHFFRDEKAPTKDRAEEYASYQDRRRQYIESILKMRREVRDFFCANFGGQLK